MDLDYDIYKRNNNKKILQIKACKWIFIYNKQ